MTQEQKDLLLKDLCARLPYGVKLKTEYFTIATLISIRKNISYGANKDLLVTYDISGEETPFQTDERSDTISKIKPYLFPLSSMTAEQLFEVQEILGKDKIKIENGFLRIVDSDRNTISYLEILALLKWFYKNHFDVNNLIPMGLAIDCTNLNIY